MLEQFTSMGPLGPTFDLCNRSNTRIIQFMLRYGANFTNIVLLLTVSLSLEFFLKKKSIRKSFHLLFADALINMSELREVDRIWRASDMLITFSLQDNAHLLNYCIWYAHNIFVVGQRPPTKWLHICSYFSLWSPFEKQRGITETTWRVDTKVSSWIRVC